MIKAVKKDAGSLVYMRMMKHDCPACGTKLKVVRMKKTVRMRSREVANFKLPATGMSGERVKFIWKEFKCPECKAHYNMKALQAIEKQAKKDASAAKKQEKKAKKAAIKAEKSAF